MPHTDALSHEQCWGLLLFTRICNHPRRPRLSRTASSYQALLLFLTPLGHPVEFIHEVLLISDTLFLLNACVLHHHSGRALGVGFATLKYRFNQNTEKVVPLLFSESTGKVSRFSLAGIEPAEHRAADCARRTWREILFREKVEDGLIRNLCAVSPCISTDPRVLMLSDFDKL